ncbi:hypothetical protein DFR69_101791 [Nocardia neocaledoniensis]|uniref:Uncharacterized protein n=1 Tax=Nocardia neocaledoniensis TaxID=236511 RepID=A0A317P5F4_9NOCA|nr:hypothetical protein DFR69_101791 [Nocardia neocaledoniensis]
MARLRGIRAIRRNTARGRRRQSRRVAGVAGQASAQPSSAPTSTEFVDRGRHDDNGLHLGQNPLRKWLHHLLPHGAFGSVD